MGPSEERQAEVYSQLSSAIEQYASEIFLDPSEYLGTFLLIVNVGGPSTDLDGVLTMKTRNEMVASIHSSSETCSGMLRYGTMVVDNELLNRD